jgi:hypothetical protein
VRRRAPRQHRAELLGGAREQLAAAPVEDHAVSPDRVEHVQLARAVAPEDVRIEALSSEAHPQIERIRARVLGGASLREIKPAPPPDGS